MNDQQFYYETMYILRPDIAEDEVNNHISKYNELLEEVENKSVFLEEFARTKIGEEEQHSLELKKMLKDYS